MEHCLALVADPDVESLAPLQAAFARWKIEVRIVEGAAQLEDALNLPGVRFVVAGMKAEREALESLLGRISQMDPQPILIAVASSPDSNVASWSDGRLFDLWSTPLEPARLDRTLRRAVRQQQLQKEVHSLRRELRSREGYKGLVGRSRPMERLREELARLAPSEGPVWLHGESGCGKKLAARTLHERSGRGQAAFAVLDCELESADGRFESRLAADLGGDPEAQGIWNGLHGGTLMVTEPGVLEPTQQRALLNSFEHARAAGIDARCVVVSCISPERQVEEGRLIGDLVGRLAVDALQLVPLRERREDIPLLAAHFVEVICTINRLPQIHIGADAMRQLEAGHWNDNVRGLRNVIEHAAIVCTAGTIGVDDLSPAASASARTVTVRRQTFRQAKGKVVSAFELEYLSGLMRRHVGNVTVASQEAGMLRSALQRLLRKYGLRSSNFRRRRGARVNPESEEPRASPS